MSSTSSDDEKITKRKLSLTIKKVSTLKKHVSSPVEFIYNLPCRLIVKIREEDGKKFLGFFVGYNERSDEKIVVVKSNIDFKILNRNDPPNCFMRSKLCFFKHGSHVHGFKNFIAWEEMASASNPFIVKNVVMLEADIEIHRPSTMSYYSKELSTGYYDLVKQRCKPSRSQALFRFRIDNVMQIEREYSPTFYVQNMPWRIMAVLQEDVKTEDEMTVSKKLGVFLRCYGVEGIDNWACYAKVNLDIWNHIPGKPPLRKRFTHFYYKDAPDYGFYSLLTSEELTNENIGLVNKGSLVIEVIVAAENPFIIPKRQADAEGPFTINNFVVPDILAHLYTLEDH